jgi:uncharacterized membrane protein YgdD (TMEM256/DUF423 family)
MNSRQTLITASLAGLLGVALGAFGAHALKPMLTEYGRTDTFELAVRYQYYHVFALLVLGLIQQNNAPARLLKWASTAFTAGMILFSGSLYVLCFTNKTTFAMVTPVGGLLLLIGWGLLLFYFVSTRLMDKNLDNTKSQRNY